MFAGLTLLAVLYKPILLGVVTSLIISYIASPVINSICLRSPFTRKKTVGILIVICVALLSALGILILPFIYEETLHILRMVPNAIL